MNSLQLKPCIYTFFSGFLCGFLIAFMLMRGTCDSRPSPSLPTTKSENKDLAVLEKTFQKRLAVLQKQNSELHEQLKTSQTRLDQSKRTVQKKEITLRKIIQANNCRKKDLRPETYSVALFDQLPCECDSLKNEVVNYINENNRKDSLYEIQLATVDSVVSLKDSIINVNEGLYNSIHAIYNQAIAAQHVLEVENRLLKKKEKRRKAKNRLLASGLVIISGLFIHFANH